jgi:TRAP transporter TAXI family solute receptor
MRIASPRHLRHLVSAACLASLTLAAWPAAAEPLRLMTGPQGGVWVPLGGSFKNMWEKAIPGLQVQPLPGAGIANIRGIDEGKADIGFGNSITSVDGITGAPPYPQKVTKVCQLANLYPQYFQMVALANAGVNSVADMKGKSIAVQPKGNTAELISQQVLKAVGLGYDSAKVNFVNSYTDAAAMLKDGHAQVFTLGTTIPASSVMDVAAGRDIKLVPVNDEIVVAMNKINPGYTKGTIKAGTYPKQDKDVDAIVYSAHLVAACSLPADQVYTMLKTIVANLPDLVAINKAMDGLTPKMMAVDIGVPFHPGAVKFYKEVGAM